MRINYLESQKHLNLGDSTYGTLAKGTDMNDVTNIGTYYMSGTYSDYINLPVEYAHRINSTILIVAKGKTTNSRIQIIMSSNIITRARNTATSWTPWKVIQGTNDILKSVYPIGSIYMSVNSTDPSTLFGGTWTQIKDTFLLAVGDKYSENSNGGNETHYHKLPIGHILNGSDKSMVINSTAGETVIQNGLHLGLKQWMFKDITENTVEQNANQETTTSESNMPPYLTVYMWKRTA